MLHSLNRLRSSCQSQPNSLRLTLFRWSLMAMLALGLTLFGGNGTSPNCARAETPETAPDQLKNALQQIDAAANSRNLQGVLQFYGKNFKGADGLTRQSLSTALSEFWKRFQTLSYRTDLQSWTTEGNAIVAETVTYITGTQRLDGRKLDLSATLRSRQRYEGGKIVQQEILTEHNQLSSGQNPPTLEIKLPETVRVGQQFNFDAIVQEPLGDDLLLGAAVEESVGVDGYVKATPIELELLPAGGIFKLGRAPYTEDNHWISAVILRGDGLSAITQRLQVRKQNR